MSNMIGHYALTKTALLGLTKLLARELHEDQIRVNGVVPGLIKT
jgi:dehydrogenase/reductase SDR family protein 4